MRRPPDGQIGISTLILGLLLFTINNPVIASAQQQPYIPKNEAHPAVPQGKSTFFDGSKQPNEALNHHNHASHSTDMRAIATLAPADGKGRAVRAPPAFQSSGPTAGLSSRLPARSLQDWEVEDIVLLATIDGTISARDRKTGAERWKFEHDQPMVETTYFPRNKSVEEATSGQDEFLWIVEPSQDGALYGYTPGASIGMQKLGLTVKQLVEELSPYYAEEPPVVYTGAKKSTIYTVDVNSGKILKMFSSDNAAVFDQTTCRPMSGFQGLEEKECGALGTLALGRTEYTVSIRSKINGDPICTIKYSEWGPNNRDKDLYDQYSTTKDNRYIYTLHDGRVLALDHLDNFEFATETDLKPTFRQKLSSPVARVFDIARPLQATSPDTELVILPQPTVPNFQGAALWEEQSRIFVNCTEGGSWYALSENQYPMVTDGALPARSSREGWTHAAPTLESLISPHLKSELVGVHPLSYQDLPYDVSLSSDDVHRLSIGPGSQDGRVKNVPMLPAKQQHFPRQIPMEAFLAIIFCIGVAYIVTQKWKLQFPFNQKPTRPIDIPSIAVESNPAVEKIEADSLPTNLTRAISAETETGKEDGLLDDTQLTPTVTPSDIPLTEDGITTTDATPKKKKAHRGKRGGKKLADKREEISPISEIPNIVDSMIEGARQNGKEIIITPDFINKTSDESTMNGPIGLHNLTIHTDRVLGNGSGGTFVFEGQFEGRDVAVKRMLPQFYELASQEVSLLESNDEHPNVIRYFCRREDQHFLYIALELCQASLWDLYKDGRHTEVPDEKFRTLAEEINLDPSRVLRQLAEGLKYLHHFRIVHRDIKPHNMLIAYSKKRAIDTFPRLVISDFGLCKTLPDNVSTLLGTTGNAGTAGWKAPELIFQPKESVNGSQHSGRDSSTGGEPGSTGTAGVKRAIDIFSLGCVFFYVLTRGQHPFDDDEGWMQLRERNIKIGQANLTPLDLYGPDTIDLVRWMLAPRPEDRPTAAQVLTHPFFWSAEERLEFLSVASDRFDQEPRDGESEILTALENRAEAVIPLVYVNAGHNTTATHSHLRSSDSAFSGSMPATTMSLIPNNAKEHNFLTALDRKFIDTLGRQRKYHPSKLADLLRALRNKHHHWDDMPDDVKARVGAIPEGYLRYWEHRFPALVVGTWRTVGETGIGGERRFQRWFGAGYGDYRSAA